MATWLLHIDLCIPIIKCGKHTWHKMSCTVLCVLFAVVTFSLHWLSSYNCENVITENMQIEKLLQHRYAQVGKIVNILYNTYYSLCSISNGGCNKLLLSVLYCLVNYQIGGLSWSTQNHEPMNWCIRYNM